MARRIPLLVLYRLMAVFGNAPTNVRLCRLATNIVLALPLKSYPCSLSIGTPGTLTRPAGPISLVPLTWVNCSIR